ncbi:MAG: UvrD-helicase domain-containing protein [Nitrospirota bacterium]
MIAPGDAAERERAIRTFDANVVVTAGAGTGKTTLLVERLVHLVVRDPDPVPVTAIVALTFTNKAAAELVVRFRERLQALAAAADGPAEAGVADEASDEVAALVSWTRTSAAVVGARLRTALTDLDRSHIGTIHAFAATLLRLFPIEAGVDPRFREADEAARRDHLAEAWEAWLQRELRREAPRTALWQRLLERATLDELFEPAAGLSVESIPASAIGGLTTVPPQVEAWLTAACDEARRLLAAHVPHRRAIEQRLAAAERVIAASADGRAIDRAAAESVANEVTSVPRGWDAGEAARAKALIKLARRLCAVDAETVALLGEGLAPFVRECRASFARAGWVTFDGLLARARDLVRDHPRVRETLKRRFGALLVDECQDTDPMQYEILCFLAEAPGASAPDWRSVRLAPGKLFMVGDPKQSIYGFRGADLEAYQDVVRTVLAQGGVECTLSTNFRSRGAILDAVNAVGERLLVHRPGLQAAYQPIASAAGASGGVKPIVRIVRSPGGTFDAADAREAEADSLAQWLSQSVFGAVTVRNGRGLEKRAEPGDVAVLLRALTDVHVYLEGLRRHGIPYVVEGERRFFAAPEVVDAINVLRTLASPHDAVALAGVLRSPLGAVTDPELYELARSGWLDYRVIETDAPPWPWLPATLYRELSALSRDIPRLPVDEAITAVFDRLPLQVLAAGGPYGDQAAANLDKLERIARELVADGLSFPGLVARLAHRVRDEVEEGESPLVDEAVNAVKVLSVHKAKGLEFPIAVLAAAHGGRRSGQRPTVLRHWSSGAVGVRVGDVSSLAGVYLTEQLAVKEAEESRRLLYVAMTRARDLLVVSGAETGRGPAPDGPAALIAEASDTVWGTLPPTDSAAASLFDWRVVEAEPARGAGMFRPAASPAWPEPSTFASRWAERAARAERIAGTPKFVTPTGFAARTGAARVARTAARSGAGHRARRIGTLVHAFLQGWDYRADIGRWPAEMEAFMAVQHDDGLAVTTDELRDILAPFFTSPLYQELAAARILGREVPLIMPWDDAIMEGVIDLIYERDGRLYVADYKTDAVDASSARAAAERYRAQGDVYARAVREGLGRDVHAFRCLFLRPAVAIDLPVRGRG